MDALEDDSDTTPCCDNQIYLQTFPNVPLLGGGGRNHPWLRITDLDYKLLFLNFAVLGSIKQLPTNLNEAPSSSSLPSQFISHLSIILIWFFHNFWLNH